MHFLFRPAHGLAVLCATAALSAGAQPALSFRSTLDGYQSAADEKLITWSSANETVYRRGGWKAYAQEAGPAESERKDEGPAGLPASTTSTAGPHAGHLTAQPDSRPPPMPTQQIIKEKP